MGSSASVGIQLRGSRRANLTANIEETPWADPASIADDCVIPIWANDLTNTSKVFFDIVGKSPSSSSSSSDNGSGSNINNMINIGRIEITLANDITPKTCANFRALCTGRGTPEGIEGEGGGGGGLTYKGSPFHRIIPGFMCQGGDITMRDGSGGESIYGDSFDDENFQLKHTSTGVLSMANAGPNTNNSQFFICTSTIAADSLDGIHVVFGFVSRGMNVVKALERLGNEEGEVSTLIEIGNCGEL